MNQKHLNHEFIEETFWKQAKKISTYPEEQEFQDRQKTMSGKKKRPFFYEV